jgi:type II secretory pathway pseudopilin PulG
MNVTIARKQKGFSLTEALVAFAVTAIGLIAVASFQARLFSTSAYSKARTEALSLAQQKIEQFKDYTLAGEDNFIDENGDGVMDADGPYEDAPIDGQNAQFTRSWDLATTNRGKQVDVTVSWQDSADETQSVSLGAEITWVSPRAGVDQIAALASPFVSSPTGRARIGDGNLSDFPAEEITQVAGPGEDGLSLYKHSEDLFLVDASDKILLTLEEACSTVDDSCQDFVRISGTVYVDTANTGTAPTDIHVIAADAAHCERWVPSGTLADPPQTATGDYRFYNYTCYLGGGWHGNIGFVKTSGIQQRDKVCQGDPISADAWEAPVIALRRAYRGMIHRGSGANRVYFSHGIKDAAVLTGQDFVFTELSPDKTEGTHCVGADAPMTRGDSSGGALFQGLPTDFFCLNADDDGNSQPDYLDNFNVDQYDVDTHCPYDPTDPPVLSHRIHGTIFIASASVVDTSKFEVVTSDGPGNCEWLAPFGAVSGGYAANYSCNVYDWGSGWTGNVEIRPGSQYIYCPSPSASFSSVGADQLRDFECTGASTVTIQGTIRSTHKTATVSAVAISDAETVGTCSLVNNTYSCQIPYRTSLWSGILKVTSSGYVCGAAAGELFFTGLTVEQSPYTYEVVVSSNSSNCPLF